MGSVILTTVLSGREVVTNRSSTVINIK